MQKTKLELDLDEPRVSSNAKFDTLNFWKGNQFQYSKLVSTACDVLSILISTVASEATFSVGEPVLD